jgi:Uma2 family endonuclease
MAQVAHDMSADPAEHGNDVQGDLIVLRGVTWADYQRLLEVRGERSVPRFTYLEGTLELMNPSHAHDFVKSSLGRLVEAWCFVNGVDFTPVGSWTLESKEAERGVEPDECYCLGDNAANEEPERPDLAIEVVYRSGAISKLDVYRKLGVPEVWIWSKGALEVHVLAGEQYARAPRSRLLPALDPEHLLRFLHVRPVSRAVREYQSALREAAGAR